MANHNIERTALSPLLAVDSSLLLQLLLDQVHWQTVARYDDGITLAAIIMENSNVHYRKHARFLTWRECAQFVEVAAREAVASSQYRTLFATAATFLKKEVMNPD
ncbi:hypothetical protein M513_00240 [Trichuris suis]|uniref:Uncharacterized protein n=1 Tax=Trichuris suis TaxID=68888 RepID=A0A085MPD1_9BILA|nr:hypothetical protein M513_00240 [Trichuris suis]